MKGKNEMKSIGTYNGDICYDCTYDEYMKLYNSNKCGDGIYIIKEQMVKKNRLIGHYDGEKVVEYGGNEFYVKPKYETVEVKVNKTADINFSDYSKVVDEFFEKLEGKEPKRSVGYLG